MNEGHRCYIHIVAGELKTKSTKNLFKKLNEHSKELQAKQEEIIKKHNSLAVQYEELEHLKVNMNDYLCRDKTEEKKESVIGAIRKHRSEEREFSKEKKKYWKKLKDNFVVGVVLGLHRLLMLLCC